MDQITWRLRRFSFLLLSLSLLPGCTEFHTLISVLFSGANSLSTSALEFDEVKSGAKSVCSILGDRTVRCLGSGEDGNLGTFNGSPLAHLDHIKQIAMGKQFTCFIAGANSQLFCFGRNDKGQLGNPVGNTSRPVPVLDMEGNAGPITDAKEVTAGDSHACAILKGGRGVCWGDNSFGQVGNPSMFGHLLKNIMENEKNPKPFQGIKSISAGGNSTCMIARDENTVFCFGERFGSSRKVNWMPQRIDLSGSLGVLQGVKQIGVGYGFGCALSRNSQVYCWGKNNMNQLGALSNAGGIPRATLVQVTYPQEMAINHVEQLSVGDHHACALHRDEKTVFCWGDNRYGQLGNISVRGNPEQVAVGSNNLTLKGVKEVSAGSDRTCIISMRDEAFCWGNGVDGVMGNEKVQSFYPARVLDANREIMANVSHIDIGFDHTCIIDMNERLYCFGINNFGQMGTQMISGPVLGPEGKGAASKVSAIGSEGSKTCLIYGEDQRAGCFGGRKIDGIENRPALNTFMIDDLKVGSQPVKGVTSVAVGKGFVCLTQANTEVLCIPEVDPNLSKAQSPIQVLDYNLHPLKDIWQIRMRNEWICGLTQETGAVWCWGKWKNEQWPNAKVLMAQGKPSSEFMQLAISEDQICGVRGIERTLHCTRLGEASADQLDFQPQVDKEGRPFKKLSVLSAGLKHFCAIDEESKLYCWGSNEFGQLGLKAKEDISVPARVTFENPRYNQVSRVSTGDHHTCITIPDEPALFCFGESLFNGPVAKEPIEFPL